MGFIESAPVASVLMRCCKHNYNIFLTLSVLVVAGDPAPFCLKNTFAFFRFYLKLHLATLNKKTATEVVFSTLIAVFIYANMHSYISKFAFAYIILILHSGIFIRIIFNFKAFSCVGGEIYV